MPYAILYLFVVDIMLDSASLRCGSRYPYRQIGTIAENIQALILCHRTSNFKS